ncbi:unnamed protein product [Sphagnum troendelagicum]
MQQTEQTRHSNDGMYDRTEIPHFHKIRGFFFCLSVSLVYAAVAAAAAALVVGAYHRKWSCIVRRRGVDF